MPLVEDQAAAFTGVRVGLRMDWATPTAAKRHNTLRMPPSGLRPTGTTSPLVISINLLLLNVMEFMIMIFRNEK